MLRGDVVKDDSASYAIFTEQESSASRTTAANVLDVIAGLLACARYASDAVSAHIRVRMEDAPTVLKLRTRECPDVWMLLPRHKWPKAWKNIQDRPCWIAMGATVRDSLDRKWMGESITVCAPSARPPRVCRRARHKME